MASATNTTERPTEAKPEAGMTKAGRKFVTAAESMIQLYATTPTGPASADILDLARKHVAAFVERNTLEEPAFDDKAAYKAFETESARLDDIEIAALQTILSFPPTNACDLEFKLEYVRQYRETTGDNAFAYEGAIEALCDSLLAARRSGVIGGSLAASDSCVWIGALVSLGEEDDEDDPIHYGGDHVILGINGAGIQVDGSPRWYPLTRVTDVLPDFIIGIDDKRNEPDDATLLGLLDRMHRHQKRASELEPAKTRTHELWEQACVSAGVWHNIDAYQRMSEAERKSYEAKRPEREARAEKLSDETGYTEAMRAWQAECTQTYLLQRAIRSMPVNTLLGLKAKAEATVHWHYDGALPDEGVDAQDRSLIMLLGDIAKVAAAPPSPYRGPALPDLSQLSWLPIWKLYKTLTAMRDQLEPLEQEEVYAVLSDYVEAWADVLFGAYADIGEYVVNSGREDLHQVRAQYTLDFAEGPVEVVGRGVSEYCQPKAA